METRLALPDEVLDKVARRIVAVAKPERIVLFGSGARGALTEKSDFDLLVVKHGAHRRKLAQEIYVNLIGVGRSVDVVVVTPEDIERFGGSPALVIEAALREGVEVYEKAAPLLPGDSVEALGENDVGGKQLHQSGMSGLQQTQGVLAAFLRNIEFERHTGVHDERAGRAARLAQSRESRSSRTIAVESGNTRPGYFAARQKQLLATRYSLLAAFRYSLTFLCIARINARNIFPTSSH